MSIKFLQNFDENYSDKWILINISLFALILLIQLRLYCKSTSNTSDIQESFKQNLNKMVTIAILLRLFLLIGIYLIETGNQWTDESSNIFLLRYICLSFPQIFWILNYLMLIRFYYKIYYNVGISILEIYFKDQLFDIQKIFKYSLAFYFITILYASMNHSKQQLVENINLLITFIYCVLTVTIIYFGKLLISKIQIIDEGDKQQLRFLISRIKFITYTWSFGLAITILYVLLKKFHLIYKHQWIYDQLLIVFSEFLSSVIFIYTTQSESKMTQEPQLKGFSNEIEMQQRFTLSQKLIYQNNV